ncbi:hypothetical protein [Zhongshania arctica]|uniref:Outer membrane lipoprotein BamD-like domain-containing protein n=1 Tax=Zhongshania arctica TaxID=3238302 RepID=A0ABV3TZC7_9GAMM
MLANTARQLCNARFVIVLLGLIAGCQSPPPPQHPNPTAQAILTTQAKTISVSHAQQLLHSQQFEAAEIDFKAILKTSSDRNVIQQALAGLTLTYLHPDSPLLDITLATATMDRLYQQMMRWPQSQPNLDLLFFSVKLYLEQRLTLNREVALREKAEAKQQQLLNEALTLQRTIEKLRQLTLQ